MIGIVNYGFGNIGSIANALNRIDIVNKIIENPKDISSFSHLILPGVGSFKKSMEVLDNKGWSHEIKKFTKKGNFLIGICLGMQLMFREGEEDGFSIGLGLIEGKVKKIKISKNQVLPHVGWNNLETINKKEIIFKNIKQSADYYFDHSYECIPLNKNVIIAETTFEKEKKIVSIIKFENIYGMQFHPEKSPPNGLNFLNNFCRIK